MLKTLSLLLTILCTSLYSMENTEEKNSLTSKNSLIQQAMTENQFLLEKHPSGTIGEEKYIKNLKKHLIPLEPPAHNTITTEQIIVSTILYTGLLFEFERAHKNLSTSSLTTFGVMGWLNADLISGIIHAVIDNMKPGDKTFFEKISNGSLWHHVYPYKMPSQSFWYISSGAHYIGLLALSGALYCDAMSSPEAAFFLTVGSFFASFSNYIHALSHRYPETNPLVLLLQKSGIIIDKKEHKKHHTGEHDKAYCVVSGWMNPVLDFCIHTITKTKNFFSKKLKKPTILSTK